MILKHKVNKEEFNKLSQLDRIEFRQRKEDINRNYETDLGSWIFLKNMFMLMGFVILMAISFYSINPLSTIAILNILPLMFRLVTLFFIILLAGEILLNFRKHKIMRELNEEYFNLKLETKPKK